MVFHKFLIWNNIYGRSNGWRKIGSLCNGRQFFQSLFFVVLCRHLSFLCYCLISKSDILNANTYKSCITDRLSEQLWSTLSNFHYFLFPFTCRLVYLFWITNLRHGINKNSTLTLTTTPTRLFPYVKPHLTSSSRHKAFVDIWISIWCTHRTDLQRANFR